MNIDIKVSKKSMWKLNSAVCAYVYTERIK